jgi:hypothetical protein
MAWFGDPAAFYRESDRAAEKFWWQTYESAPVPCYGRFMAPGSDWHAALTRALLVGPQLRAEAAAPPAAQPGPRALALDGRIPEGR